MKSNLTKRARLSPELCEECIGSTKATLEWIYSIRLIFRRMKCQNVRLHR